MPVAVKKLKSIHDHDGYREAEEKLLDLRRQLKDADARRITLDKQLSGERFTQHEAGVRRDAEAIVAGDAETEPSVRQEYLDARRQVEVLQHAIRLQQPRVNSARGDASREICKARLSDHKKHAAAIGAALDQLKTAIEAEQAFRQQLSSDGANFTSPLCACSFPRQGNASVKMLREIENWFKEMEKHEYV
ncbi:MAG: hypothetical protein KDA42_06130 [Planctomycetales bacterium]|nr:hypothetical protein [Planctomycetales bacterium]